MVAVYLTKERYEEIIAELKALKKSGREAVAEKLKHAKELGDLSENSEYQEAREDQIRLEQKILQLEDILKNYTIIKKETCSEKVEIGCKVKVRKDSDVITYIIVGSTEAKPETGFISNESPIGRNLLGKKVGDVVYVTTPKGKTSFQVLSIN